LVPASSMAYTAVFAGLGAIALATSPPGPHAELVARRAIQVALLVTIVPVPLTFGGPDAMIPVSFAALLGPVTWLVAGVCCLFVRRHAQPPSLPATASVTAGDRLGADRPAAITPQPRSGNVPWPIRTL
jgi:hypothetical protein